MDKKNDENMDIASSALLDALVKEVNSRFDLLSEEIVAIVSEMDYLKEDLDKLRTDVADITVKLSEAIDSVDSSTEPLAKEDVSMIKADMLDIKMQLKDIVTKISEKVDDNPIHRHEKRLARIEKTIRTMR